MVESISRPNNSARSLQSHTTSQNALHNAIYSASVVLKTIEVCFLLHQETIADPKVKQQLEVLF
jgi:hypothetical protein